jgi:hypothetical protein
MRGGAPREKTAGAGTSGRDEKMLECLTGRSGLQIELCVPSGLGGKEAPFTAGPTKEGEQWR